MTNYFPSNLRFLRKRKGMYQEQLGAALGKSKTAISMYELGQRSPSIEDLRQIASYFRINPDRLISEDLSIQADGDVLFEAGLIKNRIIQMHISEEEFDLIMNYLDFIESRRNKK